MSTPDATSTPYDASKPPPYAAGEPPPHAASTPYAAGEPPPYDEEPEPALGVVLDAERGSLPYTLVHGEALVAAAAWALGEAGVTPLDLTVPWPAVQDAELPLVLHDALCPLTPPAFLAACLARSVTLDRVVVGVRPVTDTVKVVVDETVGRTLDRDRLHAVAAPVVLPARVVAGLSALPSVHLPALVEHLAAAGETVELVPAPAQARRVAGPDDVRLLEALGGA